METVHDPAGVSGPHAAALERATQELNSKKRQLEDALRQVRFKTTLPSSAAFANSGHS